MAPVLTATLPVFLLILFGLFLRWRGVVPLQTWAAIEKLTYYFLFPALLVETLAGADFGGLAVGPIVAAIVLPLLLAVLLLYLCRNWITGSGPALGSVLQGIIRPNTYIGLAVASSLFGSAGLGLVSLAVAASVPLVNLLSVFTLTRLGSNTSRSTLALLGAILRNPLILACVLGIGLNLSGIGLPWISQPLLDILGSAALPMGLLAVGAGLELRGLRGGPLPALLTPVAGKLVALPLVTSLFCALFGLSELGAFVAILFNGLPAATSSFILSRQLGGDSKLMAQIITLQTALSMASLPLLLALLVSQP